MAVLNQLEGKSILKKSDEKWVINDKFARNVVPLSMAGHNSAYFSAIIFKYNGRTWKYANKINFIAFYVSYDRTLLNEPFLFDMTNDPLESTNLIDNLNINIQSALTYGIGLLNKSYTEGPPSAIDAVSVFFLVFTAQSYRYNLILFYKT